MKKLFLAFYIVAFLSSTISVFSQPGIWQTVQINPGVLLQDVYFLGDGQYGWAAGGSVASNQYLTGIVRTTNGGNNWVFTDIPVISTLTGVFFADQSTGWAVGSNGTIMHSTNGGVNWVQQSCPTSRLLAKVYFINNSTGWAVGGWNNDGPAYLVLKTTNGGTNWVDQSFGGPGYSTESVFFLNDQTGWIGCRDNTLNPKIFKTTNGGTNWISTNLPTISSNVGILSIKFATPTKGWAATTTINSTGPVLFSSDGGDNWIIQYSTGLHYHVLDVRDSNSVAVVAFRVLGGQTEKVAVTSNGGMNWTQFTPQVSNYTYGICYRGNNIWIGSDYSQILKSTDNGVNWSTQFRAVRLKSISWSSPLNGWITTGSNAGNDGFALKTTNGGLNWLPDPTSPGGSQVQWIDDNYGWMMFEGNSATVYRTTNGGTNWIQASMNSGGAWIGRMFFINQTTGWGFGSIGKIVKTTNSGETWSAQTSNTSNYVEALYFINPNEGWAGGGYGGANGFIRHTTDGGTTWQTQTPVSSSHVSDIFFLDNLKGWVICYGGSMQRTTDGGNTWSAAGSVTNYFAQRIVMIDSVKGWMCAYNSATGGSDGKGFIYKTTNSGDSWVQEWEGSIIKSDLFDLKPQGTAALWSVGNHNTILKYELPIGIIQSSNIAKEYLLQQNYPNPFNPVTNIKFDIPESRYSVLKIFNVVGEEVASLINGRLNAGSYEVTFDGSNLPSGVYFYRLTAGEFSEEKKMVLIK